MLHYTATYESGGERGEVPAATVHVRAHATKRLAAQWARDEYGAEVITETRARELIGAELDWLFAGQGIRVET